MLPCNFAVVVVQTLSLPKHMTHMRSSIAASPKTTEEKKIKDAYSEIKVVTREGNREPLDLGRLTTLIQEACQNLEDVDASRVIQNALDNMYDGISVDDVATSILITES